LLMKMQKIIYGSQLVWVKLSSKPRSRTTSEIKGSERKVK
jgi:hypothetical protein